MGTKTVGSLIDNQIRPLLGAGSESRWPDAELIEWLVGGYQEIGLVRPDAYSKTMEMLCAAGTKQSVPAGASRLLSVVRNAPNGSPIIAIERNVIDDLVPDWHSQKLGDEAENYIFDPLVPTEFYLYPPMKADSKVEVACSLDVPGHHETVATAKSEVIHLPDSYSNTLVDFVLYRAFSKHGDAASQQRAVRHYMALNNALGRKTTVDMAVAQTK